MFRRFRIEGHSMEPALRAGSSVLVRKTKRVREGDIVAFRLDNDPSKVFVKRIVNRADDDSFVAEGDNRVDTTGPYRVCRPEVIGKVVLRY